MPDLNIDPSRENIHIRPDSPEAPPEDTSPLGWFKSAVYLGWLFLVGYVMLSFVFGGGQGGPGW